ncbi:MAG: hypothetical protein ACRCYE_05905 [Sarcina sp.]
MLDEVGYSTTLVNFKNLLNSLNDMREINLDNFLNKFMVENNSWDRLDITYKLNLNDFYKLKNILTDEKNKIKLEKIRKENEADEKREAKINRLKTIARDTGEKQLYDSMTLPCNSKHEECNMDILYKYILPNGEFEEVRTHTW